MENEAMLSNKLLLEMQDNGYIAKALLEDYATVVAKIEGCKPEEVSKRVKARATELRDEALKANQ